MRSVCLVGLLLIVSLSSATAWAQEADDSLPPVTVSRRTTFVTEPKRVDGFVDLAGAVDRYFSRNVSPETNAAVLLLEALGPRPGNTPLPDEFFQQLGMAVPTADGDYFVPLKDYLGAKGIAEESDGYSAAIDQLSTAQFRPWQATEFPELVAWLDANERPLAKVALAVERKRFFAPILKPEEGSRLHRWQGLVAALLPHAQVSREIARAVMTRAMLRLASNNVQGAWADVMTLHRLGRLLGQGPFPIDAFVGVAIGGWANKASNMYIERAAPDAAMASRHANVDLPTLPALPDMAEKIHVSNRMMFVDTVLLVQDPDAAANRLLTGFSPEGVTILRQSIDMAGFPDIGWDEALSAGHPWYDRASAALRKPTHRERAEATAELNQSVDTAYKRVIERGRGPFKVGRLPADTGKMVGELIALLVMTDMSDLERTRGRAEQWDRNLRVVLALAAFKSERGGYPERLAELAPAYIKEVPEDYFASAPLRYERTAQGYSFYSVGPNGRDDGGRYSGGEGDEDDEGVRMPAGE